MNRRIRDIALTDYAAILAINNDAVPSMNSLDASALDWLVRNASYARAVEFNGALEAFLLALGPGTGYESANYRWFSENYPEFLYIDRIAVVDHARGSGHGSALYDDLAAFALGTWPCITAEVNLEPPNPRSIAFHERHGFERVGELQHAFDGTYAKRVLLMVRELR